jgi:ADP-heptose:LPS heptosyltransferase
MAIAGTTAAAFASMSAAADDDSLYRASGPRVPGVRRIAVLRANAVGDFIVALPALAALRQAYPAARITLLGRAWHAQFLCDRPGPVDEVIALPPIPGITAAPDAQAAGLPGASLARLRARRFDLALQLHGGGRYSNPFVRALGARVTAGFCAPDAEPLDRNLTYLDDHHPVALHLLECVALVGAVAAPLEPRLALRPSDVAEAADRVPPSSQPFAVLQAGATDPQRRWSPQRFAAVGDALAQRGLRVVLNGSADDVTVNRAVCAAMLAPAVDLAGRLSLGGLAGLLARADLLVSNDTGPVHLARALGTPTVTVYWVGNARSFGPLSTRRHRVAVSWCMSCPVCGAHAMHEGCAHDASLVDEVPVEAVRGLAFGLLDEIDEARREAVDDRAMGVHAKLQSAGQ